MITDALVGFALQHHMFGERDTRVDRERAVGAWARMLHDHIDPDQRRRSP